jgi:hypothetical protein
LITVPSRLALAEIWILNAHINFGPGAVGKKISELKA